MDLRDKLNEHRKRNFLCDVDLIVESTKFCAHKFVLAATCNQFNHIFMVGDGELPKDLDSQLTPKEVKNDSSSATENRPTLTENGSNETNGGEEEDEDEYEPPSFAYHVTKTENSNYVQVELPEAKANGFETILNYLYTSQFTCTRETVIDAFHNARMMKMVDIMNNCIVFLCQNMTVGQCIPTYQMALSHNYFSLMDSCKNFLLQHLPEVMNNKTFSDLSPFLLCQILSDDNLRISDEKLAMRAVIKWILNDITFRKTFADRMLSSIRFKYISDSAFSVELDKCKDVEYLKERFEAYRAFKNGDASELNTPSVSIKSRDPKGNFAQLVSLQFLPRKSYRPRILVSGGICEYRNSVIDWVDQYDLFTHSWSECNRMLQFRSGHCLVYHDKLVYVIGGQTAADHITSTVDVMDPMDYNFKPIPYETITGRKWFQTIAHGRDIYIIGGYSFNGPIDSIEVFRPKSKTGWKPSGKLKSTLYSFGAVLIGSEIYFVGGVENLAHTKEVYTMCIQTRKQTSKASMHVERSQFGLVLARDCLYAIGGRNCTDGVLSSVERYCIEEDSWTKVAPMKLPRAGLCATVHDGLIYVFGGRAHLPLLEVNPQTGRRCREDFGEVYNPSTNQWNTYNTDTFRSASYSAAVLIPPSANHS